MILEIYKIRSLGLLRILDSKLNFSRVFFFNKINVYQ